MKLFGVNALGEDGKVYAISFECSDIIDCEMMIKQLNLKVDDYGYGELLAMHPGILETPPSDEAH